jgi:hypothetical protein
VGLLELEAGAGGVHCGNVLLQSLDVCVLSDWENAALGLPSAVVTDPPPPPPPRALPPVIAPVVCLTVLPRLAGWAGSSCRGRSPWRSSSSSSRGAPPPLSWQA